jgi:hypothetical protein
MVARTPSVLPPGYLSLDEAIDRVDPGVLRDEGSDKERREFDKYLALNMSAILKTHTVPTSIYAEVQRRRRLRSAFERVCELCAYGRVPSALLLDDFTVRRGVPTKFWLDERLSTDMHLTGRAMINQHAFSGRTGWVIVDAAALDVALATRREPTPAGSSGKRKPPIPDPALRRWWKGYVKSYHDPDTRPSTKEQREAATAAFPNNAPPLEKTMQALRADKATPSEWRVAGRRPKSD